MIQRIVFLYLFVLSSSACALNTPTPPQRGFLPSDLLMSLTDMPSGWDILYSPGPYDDTSWGNIAAFGISFQAKTDFPRVNAGQEIYQYASVAKAERAFKRVFQVGTGDEPSGWKLGTLKADEFIVKCHDYGGREPTVCNWNARYDEFIVSFHTWLIPGFMSLDDLQVVVEKIDTKIADRLTLDEGSSPVEEGP